MKVNPGQPIIVSALSAYTRGGRLRPGVTDESRRSEGAEPVQVELSSRSREAQRAFEMAQAAPEIREDRVAAARARLGTGSSRELAEKLLAAHLDRLD